MPAMFGWLKHLFLDEKARKALDKSAAAAKAVPKTLPMTPKRAELMKEAMRVHKAKRKILDNLSDEARAQLVAMAITTLLNEGRESDKVAPGKKKK